MKNCFPIEIKQKDLGWKIASLVFPLISPKFNYIQPENSEIVLYENFQSLFFSN